MPSVQAELTITITEGGGETLVSAEGKGTASLAKTKIALDCDDVIERFSAQLQHENDLPDDDTVQTIGQQLYDAVFIEPIRERITALQARLNGAPMRLRLVLPERLTCYPWESLHDGVNYLAVRRDMPLVRTVSDQDKVSVKQVDHKINVLYVGTSPPGQPPLAVVGGLAKALRDAFGDTASEVRPNADVTASKAIQAARKRIDLKTLTETETTLDSLYTHLRADTHVLCFVGHGGQGLDNEGRKVPVLYLWSDDDEDYEAFITPETLVNRLRGTSLQLVVLAACNSGAMGDVESFANALTAYGVPAVVTMQTFIQEITVEPFLREFIRSLATYEPVDVAVAAGRNEMCFGPDNQIISPALYLQAKDSTLFKPKKHVAWRLVATLLLVIILFFIVSQFNTQRVETEAQISIGNEQQLRLQSETQRDRLVEIATDAGPTQPLLHDGLLWITNQGANTAQAYTLIGEPVGLPLSTGSLPERLVTHPDSPYLWTSCHDGTLTRIDPIAHIAETVPSVATPFDPLVSGDWIWIASSSGGEMVQISQETLAREMIAIPRNTFPPFVAAGYVWVVPYRESRLLRLNAATRQAEEVTLPNKVKAVLSTDDAVWLLAIGDTLLRLDAVSGQVTTHISVQGADDLQATEGMIWLINREGQSLQRFTEDSDELQTFALDFTPGLVYHTPGRLWVSEGADRMHLLDAATGEAISVFDLTGANQISGVSSDGQYLWFTVGPQGLAQAVRISDGEPNTKLAVCSGVSSPLFDGTNMWFTCPHDDQLVFVPAVFFQFRLAGFQKDSTEHAPIVFEDLLWVSVEQGGRIVAYDRQQEVYRLAPGSPLMPLQADDRYIWTAVNEAGKLVRIQMTYSLWGGREPRVDILELPGEITSINLIEGRVWVLVSDLRSLGAGAPNLYVIDRDSLATVAAHSIDIVGSNLTHIGDDVWFNAAGFTQGSITRLNAETGAVVGGPFDIPNTSLAAWSPVEVNNLLWFTLGAPSLGNSGEILASEVFSGEGQDEDNRVGLAAFDPVTSEWVDFIELPGLLPSRPDVDGTMLWYSSFGSAVPVIIREEEGIESGLFAVDVTTKTFYGPWPVCDFTVGSYLVGPYMWVGCAEPEMRFTLLSRDINDVRIVRTYENLGSRPWSPVVIGDYAWFVFRDTDSAAVFRVSTGELLQVYKLGPAPAQPVLFDGAIWVYNTGDGSLQRIAPTLAE